MKKVLAFDIGGTNTRLALVNERFEIEKCEILPTIRDDKEGFLNNIEKIISLFDVNQAEAIGAGIPGVCNRETGFIYDMSNVHVQDIPLGEIFLKKYNKKLFLRNDAEVACLAEAYSGAGVGYSRVFFITISTGLGGALVVDGENQDYITEIGHTAYKYKDIVSEYELLSSGKGIITLCKINGLDVPNAKEFFDLVRAKNELALNCYNEWLKVLTDFISLVQSSYYPDVICITGGVTKNKDLFFDELKKRNPESNLVICKHNEEAGLIGAATYAFKMMKII